MTRDASEGAAPQPPYRMNLGCGRDYRPGWLNVDVAESVKPDLVLDAFTAPWPLESNSVREIYCSHVLEHVPHAINGRPGIVVFLEECWRVCQPGATLTFRFPYHANGKYAWADPTHTRAIHPALFDYFKEGHGLEFYTHARFHVESIKYTRNVEFGGLNARYHLRKWLRVEWPNIGQRIETTVRLTAHKTA